MLAQQESGIVAVPFAEQPRIRLVLARRRQRSISLANQAFLDWAALQV
jgi:hypothetical protein